MSRIVIATGAKVVDRRDPYRVIDTTEPLRGELHPQPGEAVCVTLDGGREVLVLRRDCMEAS